MDNMITIISFSWPISEYIPVTIPNEPLSIIIFFPTHHHGSHIL